MTHIIHGDHIGRQAKIRLACSAVIFNSEKQHVLLTRRSDNSMWCLPGGMFEPGESVVEGCEREVLEETGIKIKVKRLSGIYSDPNQVVVYPDGNQYHIVVLCFVTGILEGKPGISDETTDVEWIPVQKASNMELFHDHHEHIRDAISGKTETLIR